MMLLGGGEGVSNKDEAITAGACSRVSCASAGAEILVGLGITKITAAIIVDPSSWQQFIPHIESLACPSRPQTIGADSCDMPAFSEVWPAFACPRAAHIFPAQHAIPLFCDPVAHSGVQSSATANRHTQAPSFPGAIGM